MTCRLAALFLSGLCGPILAQQYTLHTLTPEDARHFDTVKALDLAFLRLQPSQLNDDGLMRLFVLLNNCDNEPAARALGTNELDRPRILSFYRSKAPEILGGLSGEALHTVRMRIGYLGEYNTTTKKFPFLSGGPGSQPRTLPIYEIRFSRAPVDSACPSLRYLQLNTRDVAKVPDQYSVSMPTREFDGVPMDEPAARKYIEATPPTRRYVCVDITFRVLDAPPQIEGSRDNPYYQVNLRGAMSKVAAIDCSNLDGPVRAVLSPSGRMRSTGQTPATPEMATLFEAGDAAHK
jgi:hypothetical protein